MQELFSELINVLDEELKIYNKLLSLSRGKTDIIVKGRVTELDTIVKKEQTLILQLGGMEDKREELIDSISKQLGLNPSEINISELVKQLKPQQAAELKNYQSDLSGTLNELKDLNDLNSKLVKNSIEFIDFSINLMSGATETGNNYAGNGQVSVSGKRNLFDMKL